jgi:HEAT repeat protein
MFKTADPLTELALTTLVSVLIGTFLLVAVAIFRRWQQTRYSHYLESLHTRYGLILEQLLYGTRTPQGVAALRKLPLSDLERLFDPLLSTPRDSDTHFAFLLAICTELGMVELWQRRLAAADDPLPTRPASLGSHSKLHAPAAPQRLLLRAKSIRNLGILRHHPSWPLLVKALDDPHADIQTVTLNALAAIRAPGSFRVLMERLQAVALGRRATPPLPSLQAALACFDVAFCSDLLPALRHPHRRIRFLAIELLRLIVRRETAQDPLFLLTKENLSPEITDLLLTDLYRDAIGEVRGRVAEVIAFLADPRAPTALFELCFDEQWYVRLRAVRALAHPRHNTPLLLLGIRDCLRDAQWRVREAAVHTLIALGPSGKQQLYEHFLTSDDQAMREQIVEVFERTGLMASLIEAYSQGTCGVEALVVEQIASGAAPLGLPEVLRTAVPHVRLKFTERFVHYSRFKMRLQMGAPPEAAALVARQKMLEFPPALAA